MDNLTLPLIVSAQVWTGGQDFESLEMTVPMLQSIKSYLNS
ncbi:hypothetical protein [Arthrobacter psychrolactophilus]